MGLLESLLEEPISDGGDCDGRNVGDHDWPPGMQSESRGTEDLPLCLVGDAHDG